MVPYRYDPEHIAVANAAPRCQHIKLSGQRCGAPARRRRRFCHFHERILRPKRPDYAVRFIEDATSLQFALMEVLRQVGLPRPDYRACGLAFYGLQIACSNLKNFMAEQPQLELAAGEPLPAKGASAEKHLAEKAETKDDEPTLTGFLLGKLAQEKNGDPNAPPPRIRSREDFYAAVERRDRARAAPTGGASAEPCGS
jgi:hypothetical protein